MMMMMIMIMMMMIIIIVIIIYLIVLHSSDSEGLCMVEQFLDSTAVLHEALAFVQRQRYHLLFLGVTTPVPACTLEPC
jgi:uncharacterized membrane protein